MWRIYLSTGKILLFLVGLCVSGPIAAQVETEAWRLKPQLGLWFGPVTPVPGSAASNTLITSLGGGMFMRFNIPSNSLRFEVGGSYEYYTSRSVARLHSIPVYGALAYTLPINLPLSFQLKLGGGSNFMRDAPEGARNWLPIGYAGFETSFPAGRLINIGVRADYYFVYEKWLSGPSSDPNFTVYNGHFLNFGLMVNFNLSR